MPRKKKVTKVEGLGDTIEQVTKATGIDKLVKFVAGEDIDGVEIKGYKGYYVTEKGDVYSTRGRWGEQKPEKKKLRIQNGYPSFSAYPTNEGKRSKTLYLHRVLGEAFLYKPKNYSYDELTINHKNGNRTDNRLENLEWVTLKENIQHSFMELNKNRVPKEIVLDVFKLKHLEKKDNKEISKLTELSKDTIEGILYRGNHIYSDNINEIVNFFNENELEPNNPIKEKIWSCGCEERKSKLNSIFRYSKPECLTEHEHNYLSKWFSITRNVISVSDQQTLLKIYNRVFNAKKEPTACSDCFKVFLNDLRKVYDSYKIQ